MKSGVSGKAVGSAWRVIRRHGTPDADAHRNLQSGPGVQTASRGNSCRDKGAQFMAIRDDNLDPADRVYVAPPERRGGMGWLAAVIIIVLLVVLAFAFGLINVDQTKTAKLPDINVQASGGQAPAFDVNTAKIDVGSKKETVKVPDVQVGTKDTTVSLPTVSVTKADDTNK